MNFIKTNIFLYFFILVLGISGFSFAIIWPEEKGFYGFIALLALGGFCVALYIYYTKKNKRELVCPLGSDCNAVINSKYAKFLNIPLEYLGMLYYCIILIAYILLIFTNNLFSNFSLLGLVMLSGLAFLFSLYLLFAQAFLIRQWCIWCLLSAMFSTIIFITSLISLNFAVDFLSQATILIEIIHTMGFVFGLGGATLALFLFSKFLRDLIIDERELKTIQEISEIIWFGLIFVLLSQFMSFVAYAPVLAQSNVFIIQTISLFVVGISGAVLMIVFAPYLTVIPFNENEVNHKHSPVESLRKPLFLTGAITFSSWYFAFIVKSLPEYKFVVLLLIYISILTISAILALLWERKITRSL